MRPWSASFGHDPTTFRPEPGQLPERDAVPTEYRWDLTVHLRELGRVVGQLRPARRGDRGFQEASGHAGRERLVAARGVPGDGRDGRPCLSRLVLRVASVRPGSAQQRDQRPPAAGADPVRAPAAGQLVVQPGVARRSARHASRVDGRRTPISLSTASRSRACFTSRSTCSTSAASGCCRMPAVSAAFLTTATRR